MVVPNPGEQWTCMCSEGHQAFIVEAVIDNVVVMVNGSRFKLSEFQNKPTEYNKPRWKRSDNQ